MIETIETAGWVAIVIGLFATGAVAGTMAGLLGVGGGIVIVPVLSWILTFTGFPSDLSQHMAVATSLATIVPTAISSSRAHHKRGGIDFAVLRSWGPAVVLGALAGGILARYISGDVLRMVFGFVALAVAVNMSVPKTLVIADRLPHPVIASPIGGVIGLISSLMGIGGGTLAVPSQTAFSVPIRRAVGTASALGLLIAVPGVLGFIWSGWSVDGRPPLSLGYVSLPAAACIVPLTWLFAPYGAKLAHTVNQRVLKLCFAVFLALTAVKMLLSVFG
ncbi:hypothetical protein CBW24_04040 [Pacificitalea manganoxidans]|uniref:Probable membrane transporter protein n=1 Tax=Pacificitalea manganoxidans TaxID=1411902 RepID=A0A291LX31_9RHOB|nr:sulfite exporter TauE/SafE family protein [Pacificitalea manganoxidans]ATI41251.1 hypothetical protein CBW24_04040 [Pacificitalea manganoxidans]MDR6308641.1 putative membrane protein YfcA [Pacificitalea manganoxidans]